MLMDIPFPYKMSTRYVQLRMRGIYCLLFRGNKKLAISQYWNNIVNALTQYVISAKIPPNPTRNAAKLRRIIGIAIKNEKKMGNK